MPSRISASVGSGFTRRKSSAVISMPGVQKPHALEPVVLVEGLLQRVKLAVLHQAFDRPELGALGLDREHDAGARGLAIEQDGARAADPVLTAHVRAGEPEVFT